MARQAKNNVSVDVENVENVIETNQNEDVTTALTKEKQPENASSTMLNDDTLIPVKSLVSNVYYTCSKTHDPFAWVEVGDIQEMTMQQLKIMRAKHPRYFTEKWILPLNQEVLKKLNLEKVYKTNLSRNDLKKVYGNDVEEVEELLSNLSGDAREELTQKVIKATQDGKIVNIKIIRLLEKQLGIELMNLIDG